ncbi:hypothetical protein AB0D42_21225 [Streptomyces sp. NPDC048304]
MGYVLVTCGVTGSARPAAEAREAARTLVAAARREVSRRSPTLMGSHTPW